MAKNTDGLQHVRTVTSTDPKFINADGERMDVTHVGTSKDLPVAANKVYVAPGLHANRADWKTAALGAKQIQWFDTNNRHFLSDRLDKHTNLYEVTFANTFPLPASRASRAARKKRQRQPSQSCSQTKGKERLFAAAPRPRKTKTRLSSRTNSFPQKMQESSPTRQPCQKTNTSLAATRGRRSSTRVS